MAQLPVKKGDKNQTVAEIQKLLSQVGYDIISDGDFGSRTELAIIDFQSDNHLKADGVVGEVTYQALLKALPESVKTTEAVKPKVSDIDYGDLAVNKTVLQPDSQYIKQEFPKTQIFLHFTAGGPSAKNVINGWNADESRISTAYVIDRNTGEVYECFNPKYYSFHLGIEKTNGRLDKASIGLEICSYGPVKFRDGKYYVWPKDWTQEIPANNVIKLDKPFRGYSYFENFTPMQLHNIERLLRVLIKQYNIKIQQTFDVSWFDYKQEVIDKTLPGIWTHVNVRKDKSDLFPNEEVLKMLNRLAKEFYKP